MLSSAEFIQLVVKVGLVLANLSFGAWTRLRRDMT